MVPDQIAIDAARIIRQMGTNLVADMGQTIEAITPATYAAIETAAQTMQGDGGLTISIDHATITANPASPAYIAALATTTRARTLYRQHRAALAAQFATMTASAAQTQADLTALATIAAALQAGTQPTAAQQLIIDRVLVRLMIVLNS